MSKATMSSLCGNAVKDAAKTLRQNMDIATGAFGELTTDQFKAIAALMALNAMELAKNLKPEEFQRIIERD